MYSSKFIHTERNFQISSKKNSQAMTDRCRVSGTRISIYPRHLSSSVSLGVSALSLRYELSAEHKPLKPVKITYVSLKWLLFQRRSRYQWSIESAVNKKWNWKWCDDSKEQRNSEGEWNKDGHGRLSSGSVLRMLKWNASFYWHLIQERIRANCRRISGCETGIIDIIWYYFFFL